MNDLPRILLILDVDETLIHADESSGTRPANFHVGHYSVCRRPGLEDFFQSLRADFTFAIWSSSESRYLSDILKQILPNELDLAFVWDRTRCTQRIDHERQTTYFSKNLKKVRRLGYDLDRVLIIDDTPEKVEQYFGNALYVTPWYGDPSDTELPRLAAYLQTLCHLTNLRSLEKRFWRFDRPESPPTSVP